MSRGSRRWAPLRRKPLAVGALVSLVFAVAFWELAEDFARSPVVAAFDAAVSAAVFALRTPQLTAFMRVITFTGGTIAISVITLCLVAFLWPRRRDLALTALVAIAGGAALANVLKRSFDRARPAAEMALVALPGSFSFPSGHTMSSLCVAGIASYIAGRSAMRPGAKAATIAGLFLWAFLVAFSRVYLGVHWPSDVLASWFLGVAWLALIIGYAEASREAPEAARTPRTNS